MTDYRQLEPHGAGYGWGGGIDSDDTVHEEFERGAGDAQTSYTEDNDE